MCMVSFIWWSRFWSEESRLKLLVDSTERHGSLFVATRKCTCVSVGGTIMVGRSIATSVAAVDVVVGS